jgi:hypothetical protein
LRLEASHRLGPRRSGPRPTLGVEVAFPDSFPKQQAIVALRAFDSDGSVVRAGPAVFALAADAEYACRALAIDLVGTAIAAIESNRETGPPILRAASETLQVSAEARAGGSAAERKLGPLAPPTATTEHYVRVLEILPQPANRPNAPLRGFVQWLNAGAGRKAPRDPTALEHAIDLAAAGIHDHMIADYRAWSLQEDQSPAAEAPARGRGRRRDPMTSAELAAERRLIDATPTVTDCCTSTRGDGNGGDVMRPDDSKAPRLAGVSVLVEPERPGQQAYYIHSRCLAPGELHETATDDSALELLDGDDDPELHRLYVLARAERRIAERACVATASPGGRRSASPNRGRRSNSRR